MFSRDDYIFVRAVKADILVNKHVQRVDVAVCDFKRPMPGQLLHKFSFFSYHPRILSALLTTFDFYLWWLLYVGNFIFFVMFLCKRLTLPMTNHNMSAKVVFADTLGRHFRQLLNNAGFSYSTDNLVVQRRRGYPSMDGIGKSVYYVALLSVRDLLRAMFFANRQVRLVRRCCGKYNVLHAGKAFHWYSYLLALRSIRLSREIVFMNENDRWFFLFQTFEKKRKVMVQHGVLAKELLPCITPFRQTMVDKLYCFNKTEESAFRSFVRTIGEVVYFEPRICISQLKNIGKSILLICNVVLFSKLEEEILQEIVNRHPQVHVFVKPHPAHPISFYKRLKKKIRFDLIADPLLYPDADMIVAYHSSLASDYERSGRKVVYMTDMSLGDLMKRIAQEFAQV